MVRQEDADACWLWSSFLLVAKAAYAFLMIGPGIGGLYLLLHCEFFDVGGQGRPSAGVLGALLIAFLGAPYAYIIGALPALLAGLLYGAAMVVMGQREPPLLPYRLIVGLLAGVAVTSILSLFWGPKLEELIAPGAVAGAVSAAYLRKRPAWSW
jgi:hypothetical protein